MSIYPRTRLSEEISCLSCGHPNPSDSLICQVCILVLDKPEVLADQQWKTYLDQENALVIGVPCILLGLLLIAITKPAKEKMVFNLWITTGEGTEKSLKLEDGEKARAIEETILQSCSDHEGKAGR